MRIYAVYLTRFFEPGAVINIVLEKFDILLAKFWDQTRIGEKEN